MKDNTGRIVRGMLIVMMIAAWLGSTLASNSLFLLMWFYAIGQTLIYCFYMFFNRTDYYAKELAALYLDGSDPVWIQVIDTLMDFVFLYLMYWPITLLAVIIGSSIRYLLKQQLRTDLQLS